MHHPNIIQRRILPTSSSRLGVVILNQFFYIILYYICRVTNCSPNPKELGYKPNEPNTINLYDSGCKNWDFNGLSNG